MKFANASNLHRKSGVAEWRDLLFCFQFSRRLFSPGGGPSAPNYAVLLRLPETNFSFRLAGNVLAACLAPFEA